MFGNLLNLALNVIPGQTVKWLKFAGRTPTGTGKLVSSYAEPVDIYGSWQAVDANTIEALGLNLEQVHRQLFTSNPVEGIQRGEGADRLIADGYYYEVVGNADWYDLDGWRRIIATRQEPYTP